MYETVTYRVDGETTPSRFAHTADRYGYDGLVYRPSSIEAAIEIEQLQDDVDITVVRGVTLEATDRSSASQAIARARNAVDVLCVSGSSAALERFIAEQTTVDVLSGTIADGDPISHTTARAAKEHGVYVEVDVGPVLRSYGGRRVATIEAVSQTIKILDHYDVPFVISGRPQSHLELRAPRELLALGEVIDIPPEVVRRGLGAWKDIFDRTRRARSDTFIEPGVKQCGNETNDR